MIFAKSQIHHLKSISMKKFLLLLLVCTTGISLFAQSDKGEKSALFQGGFQTDPVRFQLGAQFRYNIIDNVRVVPEINFIFPKEKRSGMDINVNFHYVFALQSFPATVYPLAGIAMQNNRHSLKGGHSHSETDWGMNLGAGFTYNLSDINFLNLEMKHAFTNHNCFNLLVGYGFKF